MQFLATTLLAGLLVIGLLIAPLQIPFPPPPTAQIPAADLTTTPIGVYLYPEDDVLSPAARILGDVGARWTRSWLSWDWVEPKRTDPPTYDWSRIDSILLAARKAGLEPVFLLGGNAAWASDSFCGPIHPQAREDFQRFLGAAVRRYSAPPYGIRLWEIYNEPDSVTGPQGHCFGGRGKKYAETLWLAHTAIKAANPQALVLFGGISYDFFTTEGGLFDPNFLDDALTAGAGPYFDILAFHYYPAFADRWDAFGAGVIGKAVYLRQELSRYSLSKPLALTELGRPTRGPTTDAMAYNEEETARFVAPALAQARAAALSPIIWFTAVDKPKERYDYGLLNHFYRPEPSFRSYQAVLPALQGALFAGEWEVSGPGHALRFQHDRRIAIVAWADGTAGATIQLPVASVWQVDAHNARSLLRDGRRPDLDRVRNGQLQLQLTPDPVVLWLP